jgi:hypothetical protein
MSSQIQISESVTREEKILAFVKKNRNCTKTDVINYMDKNGASPMTTHKILKMLTKDKKIISERDKSNSQLHHLFINHRNAFNVIYNKLTEINTSIDVLNEQREKIHEYSIREGGGGHPIMTFHIYYEVPYIESLYTMLQDLLVRLGNMVKSEVDSHILYSRTISLIQKVTSGWYDVKKSQELLKAYVWNLDFDYCVHQFEKKMVFTESDLKESDVETLKSAIGFEALYQLKKIIRDYDKRFLRLPY